MARPRPAGLAKKNWPCHIKQAVPAGLAKKTGRAGHGPRPTSGLGRARHSKPFVKLILVLSSETGLPKAAKLSCSLCNAIFYASNPFRTASEHLKHSTCHNFTSPTAAASTVAALPSPPPKPISSIASPRSSAGHHSPPLHHHHQLVLFGRKEDLEALAMLEDNVKKLKSPKASLGPTLTKAQVESAVSLLSDWFYESYSVVSLSFAEHPKFRSFLHHVGLPPLSRRDLAGHFFGYDLAGLCRAVPAQAQAVLCHAGLDPRAGLSEPGTAPFMGPCLVP